MFVLEKFSDEEEKVAFYTVRSDEDAEFSEMENFINRMRKSDHKEEFYELIEFTFNSIGQVFGAQEYWFNRLEREATALPPSKHGKAIREAKINEINFQIFNNRVRLYCLRLSESVVVLFNGGVKLTKGPAHLDPGVSMYFIEANTYCERILQAIRDGMICVNYKSVVGLDENDNKIFI